MISAIPVIGWLFAEPFWLFGWMINFIPVIGAPLYSLLVGIAAQLCHNKKTKHNERNNINKCHPQVTQELGVVAFSREYVTMNSDGKMWSTVDTRITKYKLTNDPGDDAFTPGSVFIRLTPMAAGVYKYRVTYDGDDQYARAVSNVVTLTVTAATWQR